MNKNIYDIVYDRLCLWLTPDEIKKQKVLAWWNVVTAPFIGIYQDFKRYADAKRYQLYITPQVCYLTRLLNDRYDYVQRRIRINDAVTHLPLYIFLAEESKPVYIFQSGEAPPPYLYTDGEAGEIQNDFLVLVPSDISFDDNEMLKLLAGYRLAGMKPKIQRI